MACPSGKRNVTPGAVWVKTVGWTGSIMTAVSALTFGALGVASSKNPYKGCGEELLVGSSFDESSSTTCKD